jgi:hypothetical protein
MTDTTTLTALKTAGLSRFHKVGAPAKAFLSDAAIDYDQPTAKELGNQLTAFRTGVSKSTMSTRARLNETVSSCVSFNDNANSIREFVRVPETPSWAAIVANLGGRSNFFGDQIKRTIAMPQYVGQLAQFGITPQMPSIGKTLEMVATVEDETIENMFANTFADLQRHAARKVIDGSIQYGLTVQFSNNMTKRIMTAINFGDPMMVTGAKMSRNNFEQFRVRRVRTPRPLREELIGTNRARADSAAGTFQLVTKPKLPSKHARSKHEF